MVCGPHPDLRAVQGYVIYGGRLIEETLLSVGHALGRFVEFSEYANNRVFPLQRLLGKSRPDPSL